MTEMLAFPSSEDAFRRISAHLAARTDIASALEAVADEISAIIPFTHADLCLKDGPGWLVSYEVGIRTSWSQKRTRIDASPIRDLVNGACDFMLCRDAMTDPRQIFDGSASDPIFRFTLRSRVHVPLRVMGRMIGTLNISHASAGLYDRDTVQTAQNVADVLAPYLDALKTAERAHRATRVGQEAQAREEGLRRGALELTQALEQERQRIGMDLHDQTLADLTRLMREAGPDRDDLTQRLSEIVDDLRCIIDTAVPTLLQLFGFTHAVRVHLERAVGTADVDCEVIDLSDGAPDRLDGTFRTALFRIAQEAINNAARHSGAGRIEVRVEPVPGAGLSMTIRDDGCGMPADPARISGLSHMRTRASLISAELDISSEEGCVVRIFLGDGR